MPSPRFPSFRALRAAAAALFGVTAVNHAVLAARGEGNVGRHEVFVTIDVALAALLLFRRAPRAALVPVAVLAVQQVESHGSDLVASMRGAGPFDWTSLGVLLFFPALVTLLVVERRSDRRARPTGEHRGS